MIKSNVGSRKSKVLCAIALAFTPLTAAAQVFVVPLDLWDRPRTGAAVLAQPAVRQAVDRLLAQPGSRLIVRHTAMQDSLLAAEELRAWLVALALEPSRITLRNDLKPSELLTLEVLRD